METDVDTSLLNKSNNSKASLLKNFNNGPFTRIASIQNKTSHPSKCKQLYYQLFPCFKKIDMETKRHIFLRETQLNYSFCTNEIFNHKYNIISFIPVVLFNQFKLFGNLFYLIMTISQFFDELKVGFLFSYLSPLCLVVGFSMIKELYDDINRRIQDKKTNNEEYNVYIRNMNTNTLNDEIIPTKAKDLKIGDIIELTKDQRVPADIIVLKTFNDAGDNNSFIRTDQLDGETDWKLRKAIGFTQNMEIYDIMNLNASIEYKAPSKMIYEFEGVFEFVDNENLTKKESLGLENTMWSSTILASQKVIGIIIFTGDETRARMNSSIPKVKYGIIDIEINWFNIYLFFIMMSLSIVLIILKSVWEWNTLFIFFRFIVLFCGIIPISLRVNLDISKMFYSLRINKDDSIKGTLARNSTIPEELGRISYVFTDKTGTLTKNEMIFKQVALEAEQFNEENFNNLSEILKDQCEVADAPLLDIVNQKNEKDFSIETNFINENQPKPIIKRVKRNKNKVIRDAITAMVLCNNVTPVYDDKDQNKISYQASSPDEVALVKFAEQLEMKLVYRNDNMIRIVNAKGNEEEYEILANFPFSSDTKRMGIVLKNKKYNHIIFYLKGAENVIENFVKEEYKWYIKENAENIASKGLRTLVLTQKIISNEFYEKWSEEYNDALTAMDNRQGKISEMISKLESDMDFLCVTGVEDLLQDDVNLTLENLRNAGMKVWMLTGDKIETATCISISAGIKAKNHKIFTIRYDNFAHKSKELDAEAMENKLKEYSILQRDSHILIIDGDSLDLALNYREEIFFTTAMKAPSVVCCRCSPTQKRIIVKTIKKYTDKRTAAVGDGGNDVAMIQEADVGIGIVGKEGLQASLAADYSILKFNYLNVLILWWGRIAYKNTASMTNYVIHKGLIISLIQFIFSWLFYFNAVALYNGKLNFGYSCIYTSFPSVTMLIDRDIDKENALKFPNIYCDLLKGRELSIKHFLWWILKSIFQAAVIMIGSIFLFENRLFLNIVTFTFTALIFDEVLNVYTEIRKFHWFMLVTLLGTSIVYILTVWLMPEVFALGFVFKPINILLKILMLTIAGWLPFFLVNRIRKCYFPETVDILNRRIE